jgi:hypothetical protein
MNNLKDIIFELNSIIDFIEEKPSFRISRMIFSFERCLLFIKTFNEFIPSNKIDELLLKTTYSFNKSKIELIEFYIKTAKSNLINIAEIHSYLTVPKFKLCDFNFDAENLEIEVLKLIKPLSSKSDSEIAEYIRSALDSLKNRK